MLVKGLSDFYASFEVKLVNSCLGAGLKGFCDTLFFLLSLCP